MFLNFSFKALLNTPKRVSSLCFVLALEFFLGDLKREGRGVRKGSAKNGAQKKK